ncbi:MAG: helix-turn-helix domain-containing protein [Candidatus Contendobacter sp.]|nr:helix-turn-helix domain-containing protein [Candidatus Contendobacter sp.]
MNTVVAFPAVTVAQEALTIVDACRALSVCRATLYGEINSGRLRTYTLGTRRYIAVAALREFIAAREAETAAPQPQQAVA